MRLNEDPLFTQSMDIFGSMTEDQLVKAHAALVEKRREGRGDDNDRFMERLLGRMVSLCVQHR